MSTYDFLVSTASNLIATLLGVLIGVPAALHVNARTFRVSAAKEAENRASRAQASIDLLLEACSYNAKVLKRIEEVALTGRVLRNPDLRLTAWDVVMFAASDAFLKPEVLQIASHHWLRLKRLDDLNSEMYRREVLGESGWPDEETRMATWGEFYETACALGAHCEQISDALDGERHRVSES